jgi:hypothetical protein
MPAAACGSAIGTFFFLFGDCMALIYKPLWVADAVLFVTSTILNVRSHGAKNLSENWREGRILSVCGSAAHTQNTVLQYFLDRY